MTSAPLLTGSHLRTYNTIFQHPASHNLQWRDVHALFRQIATVEEEANGNLRVTRRGQVLVLHPEYTKDVADTEQLMSLRHFIERSETALPLASGKEAHWLLVINHDEARIYRSEMDGAAALRIVPHLPEGHARDVQKAKEPVPETPTGTSHGFFEPVARALQTGGPVLIFGSGKGKSNEMEQFVAWLKQHHPGLASRVTGCVVVDEHHLTEGQLLAKAREFFASAAKA
jgi:hypothetical protein